MHEPGLREYLHILRRRKWIVLLCVVIVPLAAVGFSLRQSALYGRRPTCSCATRRFPRR